MNRFYIVPALILICLTASGFIQSKETRDILFAVTMKTPVSDKGAKETPVKILLVRVDERGKSIIGSDTIVSDQLAMYIQERLFKSFMGTGLMHSSIKIEKITPAVPDPVVAVVIKGIKEGQQRALTDLCLQKYKKMYNSLAAKKQDKLKKQFPVLFQENFQ